MISAKSLVLIYWAQQTTPCTTLGRLFNAPKPMSLVHNSNEQPLPVSLLRL